MYSMLGQDARHSFCPVPVFETGERDLTRKRSSHHSVQKQKSFMKRSNGGKRVKESREFGIVIHLLDSNC